jgi:NitT/TauT family transport system substrate-binding protein
MRVPTKMSRTKKSLAAVGAAALLLAACGGADDADTADDTDTTEDAGDADDAGDDEAAADDGPSFDLSGQTLRLGSAQPEALGMGIHYAVDELERWGAEVEHSYLSNITGIEAMVAGQLDVSASSADEVLLGVAEGAPVTAISAPPSTMHYAVVVSEAIETPADLEGATLAISSPGSFNALLLREILIQEGIDPDTGGNFIQIGGTGERAAALLAGQADAAVVFIDSWLELEQQTDDLRNLGYVADLIPDLPSRLWYGEDTFLSENPDMALAMACASLNANAWIQSDKDDFIAFTEGEVDGVSPDAVGAFYDVAIDIGMYPTEPDAVVDFDALEKLNQLMVTNGDIDEPVDVAAMVDMSYLEEAAAMGCGA